MELSQKIAFFAFYFHFLIILNFLKVCQVLFQFLAILHIGPLSISEDGTTPVLLNVIKMIFLISIF